MHNKTYIDNWKISDDNFEFLYFFLKYFAIFIQDNDNLFKKKML